MTLSNDRRVYITSARAYLLGKPVPNDEIEDYLGSVGSKSGHLRKRMLASNGIETRYYAVDKNGTTVELNQDFAAKAVLRALDGRGIGLQDVDPPFFWCSDTAGVEDTPIRNED